MSYPYQGLTPNEYQKQALRTESTPDFVGNMEMSRLLHGALGMATESAELQDMIKKHLMYGKTFDRTNVLEECGDQLWYIALALHACGFTMETCMDRNIAKLKARYPERFTSETALNRNLDAERDALEGK